MGCSIKAIEYYFPKNEISTDYLSATYPNYDFSKVSKKIGIDKRYWADTDETGLDMAIQACQMLFKRIDKGTIDFVLYCSQSSDYFLPSTACILQDRVGLRNDLGAFDFNLGCSGYTYGLGLAKGLIESGQANKVLLVTAETYSKYINENDYSNKAIFGDAASASLIEFTEEENIGKFSFGTDGSGYDKLIVRNGGARNSFDPNSKELSYGSGNIYTDNELYMDGPEIFNFTTEVIPNFANEILLKNGLNSTDIDQFILHQANSFMLNLIRMKMKVSKSNFYLNLRDGGNTVSNTIPIALKRYSELNDVHSDALNLVLLGFGVGLSWCGGVIKLNQKL